MAAGGDAERWATRIRPAGIRPARIRPARIRPARIRPERVRAARTRSARTTECGPPGEWPSALDGVTAWLCLLLGIRHAKLLPKRILLEYSLGYERSADTAWPAGARAEPRV